MTTAQLMLHPGPTIRAIHPVVCKLPQVYRGGIILWSSSLFRPQFLTYVLLVSRLGIEEPTWEEFYGENVEEAKPFDEFFTKPSGDEDDSFLLPGAFNGVSSNVVITAGTPGMWFSS